MTKICSQCRQEFPRSSFRRKSSTPDGLRAECKACSAKYNPPRGLKPRPEGGLLRLAAVAARAASLGEWRGREALRAYADLKAALVAVGYQPPGPAGLVIYDADEELFPVVKESVNQ